MNRFWFSSKEAITLKNHIMQLDLVELIQYLEQSVRLLAQTFNVSTFNRN